MGISHRNRQKFVLLGLGIALTSSLYPGSVEAQNCYMITASGQRINLGSICGAKPPQANLFRIPIKRRSSKTPVIEVTFNNRYTFEMILDTGASGTVITQEMANLLKLKPTGQITAEIADGSQVKFATSVVRSISVNGAVVNNVEVAIAKGGNLGLLGHDFFGKYNVRILENAIELQPR
ncbi:retropepsin-like aspartic protease family protein [Merismopedia glauca]|uniref:Aspartyl protease n=1 Tax=Merismopedia glauca CCAP 1448/3 TaxID=1296344 RepID=A0A2T1C624_9CYAN|nr:retropepsin-like aspartic protease [Merismopedia glauca]PSB03577.1 aspartyl protease [Merismopedia glauca CCAP 1448/3]